MLTARSVLSIFSVALMMLTASAVSGQEYPTKPIRIVTSGAGGNPDILIRLLGQGISGPLHQPIIVENRTAIISAEIVGKAQPDGYSLLFTAGTFWLVPLLQKAPYDPVKDFSPVSLVGSSPNVVSVTPTLPVKTVKELIALAKAKPGQLNYASTGIGGGAHLSTELFKSMAGIDLVRVNYNAIDVGLSDMVAGRVHVYIATASGLLPHIKAGRLVGLAVTSIAPSPLVPDLPTVAASGLAGYESIVIVGIYAPARTPGTIINRLNQEMARALGTSDMKQKFLSVGADVIGGSPEQYAAVAKTEIAKWGKVIKDAGITPD